MELGLTGKTAVVTGGASNIGREITLSLAAEGVNVILADIDEAQAAKVAAIAAERGKGKVLPVRCDVTNKADAEAVIAAAVEAFGVPDILVNNVGWAEHKLFLDKGWDMAEREMNINFWGTLYITKAVLPAMVERQSGRVICVSSDAGKSGEVRESVYSAAKAGVQGFVRTLAQEVGRHSITVNGVCPSMTVPQGVDEVGERSMHHLRDRPAELMAKIIKRYPLRRVGKPTDIANMVVFLSSDAAAFITGQNISVNGGFLM
ncbi:3-oxoacyl-ACP reductase FabG [soil metagenome]